MISVWNGDAATTGPIKLPSMKGTSQTVGSRLDGASDGETGSKMSAESIHHPHFPIPSSVQSKRVSKQLDLLDLTMLDLVGLDLHTKPSRGIRTWQLIASPQPSLPQIRRSSFRVFQQLALVERGEEELPDKRQDENKESRQSQPERSTRPSTGNDELVDHQRDLFSSLQSSSFRPLLDGLGHLQGVQLSEPESKDHREKEGLEKQSPHAESFGSSSHERHRLSLSSLHERKHEMPFSFFHTFILVSFSSSHKQPWTSAWLVCWVSRQDRRTKL